MFGVYYQSIVGTYLPKSDWITFFSRLMFYPFLMVGAVVYAIVTMFRMRGYEAIQRSPGYRAGFYVKERLPALQAKTAHITRNDERIVASANLDDMGNVWYVMRPGRHHHVLWYMAQYGMNKRSVDQGFLTNKFRYLDREEARELAVYTKQCPDPDHSTDLFSEDLWSTPSYLAQKE